MLAVLVALFAGKTEYDEIKHNFIGKGPEFSPEMMIEFIRNNNRVIEIPVSYYTRLGGQI